MLFVRLPRLPCLQLVKLHTLVWFPQYAADMNKKIAVGSAAVLAALTVAGCKPSGNTPPPTSSSSAGSGTVTPTATYSSPAAPVTDPAATATMPVTHPASKTATYGHVILKAGGGTIALATAGVIGSRVYAARYHPGSHAEDWNKNNEPGGSFPGGRFAFFWAPGGVQTNKYLHDGGASSAYLVNGAPAATIFTAVPEGGGYVALEYLPGGTESSGFVLTYNGHGLVTLKGAGSPIKPTADQLWKTG